MRLNKNAARFWVGVVVGLGAIDYALACRQDGSSFSEGNRWLFRVDTPGGRAAFLTALSTAASAYAVHILKKEARP